MAKRPSLGRGLEAILGDVEEAYTKELANSSDKNVVLEIPISKIEPNPYQPRTNFPKESLDELAASIKRHGLIQPIIVIKKGSKFTLIAGERRLRATEILGMDTIKAIVADIKSQNLREIALIENIQRQDLNPIELANSYKELISEYNITQETLSNIIKKSRAQITNTLRLLNLDQKTQNALIDGKITQGHAKIMVGLAKSDELKILEQILANNLSVRELEKIIQNLKNSSHLKPVRKTDENFKKEFENFKKVLDKMQISSQIKGKNIILKFKNIENLRSLVEKISEK